MYVHETGTTGAPTVVFLHGNGATGDMWRSHAERLTDFHCLIPDFPGFGQSRGSEWVSLAETAREIADLIEARAFGGRAHVVGLSLGGSVVLTLLGRSPGRVDHAIVDGAGVLPLANVGLMKLGLRALHPFLKTDFVIRQIAQGMKLPPKEFESFRRNMRSMSASSFTRSFIEALSLRQPPGLERVTCPSLFVAGEKEADATHASNRLLARLLPCGECRVAPGMGHGWLAENPELHVRMVRAWLQDEPLPPELDECFAANT